MSEAPEVESPSGSSSSGPFTIHVCMKYKYRPTDFMTIYTYVMAVLILIVAILGLTSIAYYGYYAGYTVYSIIKERGRG